MMEQRQIISFSFFDAKGLPLTNYSVGDIIIESLKIPEGFVGKIIDNDTIFDTAGGALDYFLKRASGKETKFRQAISADDSGFINKVLHEGDTVLIKLNATGVGILDIVWDGEIKQVRKLDESLEDFGEDEF